WVSLPSGKAVGALLLPAHVFEANTFTVQGVGIQFKGQQAAVVNNTLQCPVTAAALTCQLGVFDNNQITGASTKANQSGLINLFPLRVSEQRVVCRINGNRLMSGMVHGILISGRLQELIVQDNVIENMALNGISAARVVSLQSVRISGNDIRNCNPGDKTASS